MLGNVFGRNPIARYGNCRDPKAKKMVCVEIISVSVALLSFTDKIVILYFFYWHWYSHFSMVVFSLFRAFDVVIITSQSLHH
mmetsp:Transcript_17282/g.35505  ORF Transcript_17282/g.35505 Transcript_17282/m.35505 type:complete len:82 (+) Transcript_17282:282-527(+)